MTSIWYCNGCDWFEDLRFSFLIVARIGVAILVVKLLRVLCEIVLQVSLIDAAWESLRVFFLLFLCMCRFIYSAGFEQNFLAWGEQNQSVPELMMQMSLVDETETACMRRVKRIGTNI